MKKLITSAEFYLFLVEVLKKNARKRVTIRDTAVGFVRDRRYDSCSTGDDTDRRFSTADRRDKVVFETSCRTSVPRFSIDDSPP